MKLRWLIYCIAVCWTGWGYGLSPVRTLLQQNRLDEALRICRQFEVLSTIDNDNFTACTWVYFRSNLFESGEALRKKIKGSPNVETQLLAAYSLAKQKKFPEAHQVLSELEKETKGSKAFLDVQELNGEVYEEEGRLDTAAFVYKLTVADDAKRGRAQWGLARYHLKRNESSRAIIHLEKTAALWPRHLASRYNLGVLYFEQNNYTKAGKWLASAYELNAADPGVLEYLGNVFEKKGQWNNAVKYWKKALAINPDMAAPKQKMAQYYIKLVEESIESKNFPKAQKQIEIAQGLGAQDPKFLLYQGMISRSKQEWEKASGEFQAYLGSVPEDPDGLRELSICYINLKLLKEAEEALQKAVAVAPSDGEIHSWLAFVLEAQGQFDDAKGQWKKAIKLLKDPIEKGKATRRLASIEEKIRKKNE